jgi:hypothetical protein
VDLGTIALGDEQAFRGHGENAYTCNMLQENCGNDAYEGRLVSPIGVLLSDLRHRLRCSWLNIRYNQI